MGLLQAPVDNGRAIQALHQLPQVRLVPRCHPGTRLRHPLLQRGQQAARHIPSPLYAAAIDLEALEREAAREEEDEEVVIVNPGPRDKPRSRRYKEVRAKVTLRLAHTLKDLTSVVVRGFDCFRRSCLGRACSLSVCMIPCIPSTSRIPIVLFFQLCST